MSKKSNNISYIIGFALIFSITAYFIFSGDEDGKQGAAGASESASVHKDGEAVASLFGGQQGMTGDSREKSLFESGFWKSGVPEVNEEAYKENGNSNPDILDPVSEGNPINPATGQPYTDSMMEQFSELAKKFPGNSMIPIRQTPEEKYKAEQERSEMQAISGVIATREASPDEINRYYDYRKKQVSDRVELVKYVMESQGENLSDEYREQFQKVLDMNNNELKAFEDSRNKLLGKTSPPAK